MDIIRAHDHINVFFSTLTHISHVSFLWGIGKQCRTRSDATKRGVRSGSLLFASRVFFQNFNEIKLTTQQSLNTKWIRSIDKGRKFHYA